MYQFNINITSTLILRIWLSVCLAVSTLPIDASCKLPVYKNAPPQYHKLLDEALRRAGSNAVELGQALRQAPQEHAEAVAFLISYMPQRDLQTLTASFILDNVACAYEAKERFPWGKSIPKDVFFNDVLPYCVMNETRDNWRRDFYERFTKYVAGARDIFEAIEALNKNIRDEVQVDYNTKREKPDQSPYESMRQNMASCSGLAVLLTDAFRAVCIPSRIAGTPNWYDERGNHSWNEVWADGKWYFTEYYPSGLDKSWFLSSAGRADEHSAEHAIYATSFRPTGIHFPLVWDSTITYVAAENVTKRYVELYRKELADKLKGDYINVKVTYVDPTRDGDKRLAVNVDVFDSNGQVDGGRTADGNRDLNDFLTFTLKKNHEYLLKYFLPDGTERQYRFATADKEILVELK